MNEFKEYGDIKLLKIILNKEKKSRGYAFIEYVHKADFYKAFR